MKNLILILVLLIFTNIVQAKPNYTYTLNNTNNNTKKVCTKSDFKISSGISTKKSYVKIKYGIVDIKFSS